MKDGIPAVISTQVLDPEMLATVIRDARLSSCQLSGRFAGEYRRHFGESHCETLASGLLENA